MPPMTGRVVAGRYRLIEPIGRGAMGVVWRASDQLLDRDVAVKEVQLNAALGDAERANAYRRTLREARTAARLSHRGVVTVFDVVEEDGRRWIIMELVRSQSLDALLATDGPMPAKRAARIAEQLLSALAHAHAAGVLHRDVKPSNVLIATGAFDERAVLTDFGIAQFAGDPRLTQTGMVMGSPGFTAPERIRGGAATPASDLWSLGATIYAAVEGSGPYERRGGAITTMSAIINEDAPVAASSGRLAPLIAALLRRDPATRPSAAAAARLFADVLPMLGGAAPEPPHPETVMSSYAPPPAAPAASAAARAAAGPAVDEAVAAPPVGSAEAAPAAVVNVAAEYLDVAGEEPADGEGAAAAASALAGVGAAAAADVAVDEAVTTPVVPVAPAAPATPAAPEPAPAPRPAAAAEPLAAELSAAGAAGA